MTEEEELRREEEEEHEKRLLLVRKNLELARDNFPDFVRLMRPDWKVVPEFHHTLNGVIDRLFKGELIGPAGKPVFNLMVNMPFRHNKSETCTKLGPAWNIGRHPERHHMTGSHSKDLSLEFGRDVKHYVTSNMYKLIFPGFDLRQGAKSTHSFTTNGGGKYFAVGLRGGATGRPANVLNLDDPIKNRAQADSPIQMKEIWGNIVSAFDRRLEPAVDGFPFIRLVVMTRWAPDDPCGRYQKTDAWKQGLWYHLKFQGVLDENTGETLWPERFPYSHFQAMKEADPVEYYSQVQQEPFTPGGSLLQRSAWGYYQPALLERERIVSIIIAADTAQKKDESNDKTAIGTLALMDTGDIFVLDVVNKRMEYPELREFLPTYAGKYLSQGLHGIYIEDKSSGSSLVQDMRVSTRLPVIAWKPPYIGDKVAKVKLVSPLQHAGRVHLPVGAHWVEPLVQQAEQFPHSEFDDMVDMLAIGLNVLSKAGGALDGFDASTESLRSVVSRSRKIILPGKENHRRASLATLLGNRQSLSRPLGA